MNVYDEAHNLERAVRESEEFKQFEEMKAKVEGNDTVKTMIDDFQKKQIEMQKRQMLGEEITSEMMESVQELHGIITQDPLALEYLQCNLRFSMMMQDIFKILGDLMGEGDKDEAKGNDN